MTIPPAPTQPVAMEWGVRLPDVAGAPPEVIVCTDMPDALAALSGIGWLVPGALLVWRTPGGVWAPAAGVDEVPMPHVSHVTDGNCLVTHGRSGSEDYRTHGETRVQDGGDR